MKTILPLLSVCSWSQVRLRETTISDSGPSYETTITGDGFGKFVSTKTVWCCLEISGSGSAMDNGRIVGEFPRKRSPDPW